MPNETDTTEMKEVFPMDLGAFYLTDKMGVKLSAVTVQEIFNAPMWKSYFINGLGDFEMVDRRTGRWRKFNIVR